MSNKFNKYLKQFASGAGDAATNPKGLVGNWQHATRIFVDDTYRLSPHTKFLFYVHFDVNENVLNKLTQNWRKDTHGEELGMLVKRTDLPKFSFDTVTKNQYNRKRILHKTIEYQPVNISLHDDSNTVVSSLWALYFQYYIKDRLNPDDAYRYNDYATVFSNRYGLDTGINFAEAGQRPFLRSATIYTLSRRKFVGYTLINPRITDWSHGNVDYFESDTIESNMTLSYETVKYTSGNVTYDTPKGFANLHYDTLPSPLTVQGGGVENALFEGGLLDGAAQIFGDISSGALFESPESFLATALKAANVYKNADGLTLDDLEDQGIAILTGQAGRLFDPSTLTFSGGALNNLGALFPTTDSQGTSATQRSLASQSVSRERPLQNINQNGGGLPPESSAGP